VLQLDEGLQQSATYAGVADLPGVHSPIRELALFLRLPSLVLRSCAVTGERGHAMTASGSTPATMLFPSKREDEAEYQYHDSCNRLYHLLIAKTRIVSVPVDIGQK
jgi:hypothetical protein